MKHPRLLSVLLAVAMLFAVACGGDDSESEEPTETTESEAPAAEDPAAPAGDDPEAPAGDDPEAQMTAIIECLHDAGITSALQTNTLFNEANRITLDPPYTLIYIYDDPSKIQGDIPKIEENSGSGSSIVEIDPNVLVSYQVKPGDAAETIEGCAEGG